MAYDIYGNDLRKGHCEVHPHVHEEYPCSVCYSENRQRDQRRQEPEPTSLDYEKMYIELAQKYQDLETEYINLKEAPSQFEDEVQTLKSEIEELKKEREAYGRAKWNEACDLQKKSCYDSLNIDPYRPGHCVENANKPEFQP